MGRPWIILRITHRDRFAPRVTSGFFLAAFWKFFSRHLPLFRHGFGPAPLNLRGPDRFRRRARDDDGCSLLPSSCIPSPVSCARNKRWFVVSCPLGCPLFWSPPFGLGQANRITQIWAPPLRLDRLEKTANRLQQTTSYFEDRAPCSSETVPFFCGGSFTPPRRALFLGIGAFSLGQRQTRTRPGAVA
jgi:hypothetical protein